MYDLSPLFYYRPVFMIELIIAQSLFIFYLKPKNNFLLKYIIGFIVCLGISFAIPIISFSAVYCSILFFVMFIFTIAFWKFVCNEPMKNVVFFAIAGYTVQHIAHEFCELFLIASSFENLSVSFGVYNSGSVFLGSNWYIYLIFYIIQLQIFFFTYFLTYFFIKSRRRTCEAIHLKFSTLLVLVGFLVLIDIIFSSFIIYSLPINTDSNTKVLLHLFNIFSCVVTGILLFEIPTRKKVESDLVIVEQLRSREKMQYVVSKENIENINIKCHDLKHIINCIDKNESFPKEELYEMKKIVDNYDSIFKTPNSALNVVLTEKNIICKKNNITFSCIADGVKLLFMSETDIYTLFGNMIDNAIEAVCKLKEGERSIGLSICNKGRFLLINIYNGYNQELRFENKLPLTTKKDIQNHGYGLKSISNIVKKYNGEIRIKTNNNIFEINIIFQIEK